jgi:hypothetical protein
MCLSSGQLTGFLQTIAESLGRCSSARSKPSMAQSHTATPEPAAQQSFGSGMERIAKFAQGAIMPVQG